MAGFMRRAAKQDEAAQAAVKGTGQKKASTAQSWQQKLKLGSHYGIERFGVMVGACTVTGAIILSSTVAYAANAGNQNIADVAQYTTDFLTSRTQNAGAVTGVYNNADKTRAFVMMNFATPEAMPRDVDDFFVEVSGIDGKKVSGARTKVNQATVGSIYMFGNTGYLGVLLEAPTGFDNQLLNLTISTKKQIADDNLMTPDQLKEYGYGEAFAQVDQWRVIINPVGESATQLEALNAEAEPNVRSLLADTVYLNDEAIIRKEANDQLAEMKNAMVRIGAMEEAMATEKTTIGSQPNVRLVPPVLPQYIEGDVLEGRSSDEVEAFLDGSKSPTGETMFPPEVEQENARSRYLDFIYPGQAQENVTATNEDQIVETNDKSVVEYYVPNTLRLNARNTFPGGINMDWRSRTIVEGYVDAIVPQGEDPHDYLMKLAALPAPEGSNDLVQWSLTNGMSLNELSSTDPKAQSLLSLAASADEAYAQYYNVKNGYQRVTMMKLLQLELNLAATVEATTINAGLSGSGPGTNTDGVGVDVML